MKRDLSGMMNMETLLPKKSLNCSWEKARNSMKAETLVFISMKLWETQCLLRGLMQSQCHQQLEGCFLLRRLPHLHQQLTL